MNKESSMAQTLVMNAIEILLTFDSHDNDTFKFRKKPVMPKILS